MKSGDAYSKVGSSKGRVRNKKDVNVAIGGTNRSRSTVASRQLLLTCVPRMEHVSVWDILALAVRMSITELTENEKRGGTVFITQLLGQKINRHPNSDHRGGTTN